MKEETFLKKARKYVKAKYGSQRKYSKIIDKHPQYVSMGLLGRKPPPEELLKEMGWYRNTEFVVTYKKRKKEEKDE